MATLAQLVAAALWLAAWTFLAAMLVEPALREVLPAGIGRHLPAAVALLLLPLLFGQRILDALLARRRPAVHAYTVVAWVFYACAAGVFLLGLSALVTDGLVSRTPLYPIAGRQPVLWAAFGLAFVMLGRTHRTAARWSAMLSRRVEDAGDEPPAEAPAPEPEDTADPQAEEAAREERRRQDAVIEAGRAAERRLHAGRTPAAPWSEAELPRLEEELEPMAAAAEVLLARALAEGALDEASAHLRNSLVLQAGYTAHSLIAHLPPDILEPKLDELAATLCESARERALSLGIAAPEIDRAHLAACSFTIDGV